MVPFREYINSWNSESVESFHIYRDALHYGSKVREISQSDIKKKFRTGEPLMDRFSLEDYYRWSQGENSIVFVIESGNEISAICHLLVFEKKIMLNMLARNILISAHGAGTSLLSFVEGFASNVLGIHEITLESLDRENLLRFYQKRGFVMQKPAVEDKKWGKLYPMLKRIASSSN